jgi:hypothetical protein
MSFDNVVMEVPTDELRMQPIMLGDVQIAYNDLWEKYPVQRIANAYDLPLIGSDLAKIALTEHTSECGIDCMSEFTIVTYTDSALVDDVKFYKIAEDGSKELSNIRNYRFSYFGNIIDYETQCDKAETIIDEKNGSSYETQNCYQVEVGSHQDWITYNVGDVLPKGNYKVRLEGQKRPDWGYDWIIKTQGKTIDEWAVWGNISTGSQAEVILNSPTNGSIQYVKTVTTNASANVTGGATLVNVTLYDNSTGSWGARNTTTFLTSATPLNYYRLDEASGAVLDQQSNNSATNTGATANVAGLISKAYNFTSATQYILSDANIGISATSNRTFNLWMKRLHTSGTGKLMFTVGTAESAGNSFQYYYNEADMGAGLSMGIISGASVNCGNIINDVNWHMLTFVYNGTGVLCYNNGAYVAKSDASSVSFPAGKMKLGNGFSNGNQFQGLIDEVGIWDSALTSTQINTLYNFGAGSRITSQTSTTQTFLNTYASGSNNLWNMQFCDSDGACGFSTSNYTFSIDSTAPSVVLNYPTSLINYGVVNGTLQLNFTTSDTNLDKVWYNYNGTNITIAGATSGVANLSNITLSTKKNVTIYANDTAGNLNTSVFSWDYKVFENSRTANNSSYETAYENYQINLTANSSLTAVTLDYNGTEYSLVNTIDGVWSYSRDLPSSVVGNNSVRYKFTYSGDTFYSDYSYQNVLPITFVACNATYATKFINFTFKDENTLANLNATMQTATWSYYLGSGTQSKSYVFTSATNASNHTFCASINRTFYATPSITYLATGYPARFYTPGVLTLTNTTTNTTLYLLASTDGIYVTFQTISSLNSPISGASVLITRLIAGATTTIGQGITDSAGAYTIWLNPNYDHVITASKTGFGSNSQTIRPTQSSYTLILTAAQNYTYVSDFSGLLWGIFPRGVVIDEATSFGFNISSIYGTIVKCKIELLSNNKSIVLASGETIAANGSYCTAITTYVPNAIYPQMKGRLLIDTGNGYEILEEDAYWRRLNYNTTGLTFTDWFNSMNSTNLDLSYFNNDEQHREYTNILIFFLIVMIICASLNSAGWDIQTSGGMIFLVGILVWIASVPGFLMLSDISPYQFVDQYFVAIIYTMFMIGFGSRSFN